MTAVILLFQNATVTADWISYSAVVVLQIVTFNWKMNDI